MNKKQITFLWLGIIGALIAGTLIGFPCLIRAVNGGALFSAATMVSLYIAVYTLEATLLIAVLIYSLQNNAAEQKTRRRAENAKRIIYTELAAGLESIVRLPRCGNARAVSDHLSALFLAYLPDMQHCLDPAQLHHLIKMIDMLTNMARLSVEDRGEAAEYIEGELPAIVKPQFYPAMISRFSGRFSALSDYRCVLNGDTRSVLQAISEDPLPPDGETCLYTADGKKLVELSEEGRIKIYDSDGSLLCDAVLDKDSADLRGIASGWARLDDYEGEFLDGLRHGKGCSYSAVYHHKLFDGSWNRGKPLEGIQFDVVVEKCRDAEDDFAALFPYWSEKSLITSPIMDYLFREEEDWEADRWYVCDICGKADDRCGKETNVRPLLAFMEKEDHAHFQNVMEMLRKDEKEGDQ